MNTWPKHIFRLVAVLGAGQLLFSPFHAGAATRPPPVPMPKSPVESFRELLAMNPDERQRAVADRPPAMQKQILAKVSEYLALRPDDRELRLRATELRWYLFPLMNTPATNRAAQLAFVPVELRKVAEDRLAQWDRLPPATQKELLENELTARYFAQFETSTPQQRTTLFAGISSQRRAQLEAGMARWGALTPEQRRKTGERFDQFFELTPREKGKALRTLPDAERQQMEKTLRTFEKLPKAQRELCVRAFEQFVGLSFEERLQFLKNAERWRLMSPDERQAWRDLVAKVPGWPPAPPAPAPPKPPAVPVPVATNAN
jgi:hypothetical protein